MNTCVALFSGSLAFVASARPKNELGTMLQHIHNSLLNYADMQCAAGVPDPLVLSGVLSCLEVVIKNCPYHRIAPSVTAALLQHAVLPSAMRSTPNLRFEELFTTCVCR